MSRRSFKAEKNDTTEAYRLFVADKCRLGLASKAHMSAASDNTCVVTSGRYETVTAATSNVGTAGEDNRQIKC